MPYTRGQRLRLLRELKGVEQKEAATAIGISRPYLSLLERDQKGRNLDHLRGTLERAASYYGVISAYLLAETPQEYVGAFVAQLEDDVPVSLGVRLRIVLDELRVRWGDEYGVDWLAEALGTTVDVVAGYLADEVPVTDTVAAQIAAITGASVEWLVPRPTTESDQVAAIRRVVDLAVSNGVAPTDLEMLVQAWLVAQRANAKRPSG